MKQETHSLNKTQFIIKNHSNMTRSEIAAYLGESPRWVKRQIQNLLKSGAIKNKRPQNKKPLSESDWIPEIKRRSFELRDRFRKTNIEIIDILKDEFGFDINPGSFQLWMKKFGYKYKTKQEWLKKYLPEEELKGLLNKYFTMVDISKYIQEKHDVYISDDQILKYVQSCGFMSQRLKRIHDVHDKANSFSKEWLRSLDFLG